MDKNTSLGLLLMLLFAIGYVYLTKPTDEEILAQRQQIQADSIAASKAVQETNTLTPPIVQPVVKDSVSIAANAQKDSIKQVQQLAILGQFASLASGIEKAQTLENQFIKADFTSHGGKISQVELKTFKTWNDKPLILIDKEFSSMELKVKQTTGMEVDLYDLYFDQGIFSKQGDTTTLTYTAQLINGNKIIQTYRLAPKSYVIEYDLDLGKEPTIDMTDLQFHWEQKYKRLEQRVEGYLEAKKKTAVNFYNVEDGMETIGESSEDIQKETMALPTWFSHKQKFFSSSLISDITPFTEGTFELNPTMAKDTSYIKTANTLVKIDIAALKAQKAPMKFYFGPNNYRIMGKVTEGFNDNVYLGIVFVSWVNKLIIIPIFHFLEGFISNYGIIILILVFIIKLALSPLSYKSYKGMAKMRVLKPELDELKEKYPDDMQKQQSEQMKLYSQFGISPLSGCIPMILQMPILFAMFYFFPNSVELRQETFLWANDLSTYDAFIQFGFDLPLLGGHLSLFTVLMTGSTLLYTWMNNQMTTVQGPMKNIGYLMPVVFFFVLNSYPAGLTFYYFVSNIVTFSQQAIIKKTINEDKIRLELEANKKRQGTKKKSGWRRRLDEAMKAQQEMQDKKKKR